MGLEGHPSSALFSDFCRALGNRLPHTWVSGAATRVEKLASGKFRVQVGEGGRSLRCDAVVLALGGCGTPQIPRAFQAARERQTPNIVHTDELFAGAVNGATLRELVRSKVEKAAAVSGLLTVLVIGGGIFWLGL